MTHYVDGVTTKMKTFNTTSPRFLSCRMELVEARKAIKTYNPNKEVLHLKTLKPSWKKSKTNRDNIRKKEEKKKKGPGDIDSYKGLKPYKRRKRRDMPRGSHSQQSPSHEFLSKTMWVFSKISPMEYL